jgi:hypothetical protein
MTDTMTHAQAAQRPRDHVALRAFGSARRVSPPPTWVDSPIGFGGDRGLAAP